MWDLEQFQFQIPEIWLNISKFPGTSFLKFPIVKTFLKFEISYCALKSPSSSTPWKCRVAGLAVRVARDRERAGPAEAVEDLARSFVSQVSLICAEEEERHRKETLEVEDLAGL